MNENLLKTYFATGERVVPTGGSCRLPRSWGLQADVQNYSIPDAAPQTINLPPIRSMRDASCPHI